MLLTQVGKGKECLWMDGWDECGTKVSGVWRPVESKWDVEQQEGF